MERPAPDLLAEPRRPMERPAPDLLARPAVCGHPTGMILTRAPSRAPFTLAVKITPGPQTCSRAPVGSPASALRSDHRRGVARPTASGMCGNNTQTGFYNSFAIPDAFRLLVSRTSSISPERSEPRGIPFLTHAPLARPSAMARFFS